MGTAVGPVTAVTTAAEPPLQSQGGGGFEPVGGILERAKGIEPSS